ncbi:MAG TPA: hypothetical protein VNG29_01065 [Candidatus Paceibacterota bacterium]|nr:hypothetical protein [Candidatus Paceibacterota bacterium]
MKTKKLEALAGDAETRGKSEEIDRILREAYALMYRRKKIAKEEAEQGGKPGVTDESESSKKILQGHIARLSVLGMPEGQLSKLIASLDDPLLTEY